MINICYLVNQYPKVSHTFIRREILALESLGASVHRVSIRRTIESLVDETDMREDQSTYYLLEDKRQIIKSVLSAGVGRPLAFLRACGTTLRLAKKSHSYLKSIIYLAEACSLKSFCERNNVEHLHIHFGTNPATVGAICRSLGGPDYSFTVHGPDEFDDPKGISLGLKVAQSKFTVAITSFCKSQLYRWVAYHDWYKIKVVHCSIDGEMLDHPVAPIPVTNRFLHIGRLSEQKGQMLLLESIRILKDQGVDVYLDIVGDGDFRSAIEQFIRSHKLNDRVRLLGWKSSKDIRLLLDQSSALALPSFAEGLPVVIMESLGRARPVVTTRIAGIPELVDDSCGELVIPGDALGFAEALRSIALSTTTDLDALGAAGREKVLEQHNSRVEAQKLLDHIRVRA